MLAVVVRELSEHQGAFLFDCCVFIARFVSSSCYSSAKTRIRPVKSYQMPLTSPCQSDSMSTHIQGSLPFCGSPGNMETSTMMQDVVLVMRFGRLIFVKPRITPHSWGRKNLMTLGHWWGHCFIY